MSLPAYSSLPLRRNERPSRHLEIAATAAQRRARPKLVYAIVIVGGIGAILLAQLLLSIATADGAYRISALQVQERDYSRTQSATRERLDVLRSTQNLTRNAEALGMIASGNPVFLDAGSGQVSGVPSAAGGSLTASGNLIANALLSGSAIDPAALAAQNAVADQAARDSMAADAATAEGGGISTPGALADPGAAGAPAPTASAPSLPSTPGVLPSPTTR
ncbi:MAG: hypothetical protein HY996_10970 [Micrococcales bacterium]|nr:hypothetical protein [Micrococcales bacterium]